MEYISLCQFKDTIMKKIKDEDNIENKLKSFVVFELFRLFKVSLENDDIAITPTSFKHTIGMKNEMWNELNHQDSQEFLNFLISQLEEEVGEKCEFIPGKILEENIIEQSLEQSVQNILAIKAWERFQAKEFSPLKYMFNGMSSSDRKCSVCNSVSYNFEPFVTLPVAIPIKNSHDNKDFSIYECFEHMVEEERLDVDNMFNCDMCGVKNQGYNKTLLWQTPKILVIHIKRFMVNCYGIPTQKLTNKITYPITDLDLSKYFNPNSPHKESAKYDLIGVNRHQSFGFGKNINQGHYTSFVKNIMNNNWFHYNDSNPLELITNMEQLQDQNAYLLFYYRHD
jgi:ubiquitin C-terminal hydrolase